MHEAGIGIGLFNHHSPMGPFNHHLDFLDSKILLGILRGTIGLERALGKEHKSHGFGQLHDRLGS